MLLLFDLVSAEYIMQSQWDTLDCSNAPVMIAILNDTFSTNWTVLADEIAPIPTCGLTSVALYSGCCIQMTYYVSVPYSFERHEIDTIGSDQYPKASNENEYCQLKSIDSGSSYGYEEILFLDSDSCINDFYQCEENIFSIYSNQGCFGTRSTVNILDGGVHAVSDFGNVTISKIKPTDGTMQTYWTTSNVYEGIPQHLDGYLPIEIFGIISCAVSLLVFTVTFGVYFNRLCRVQNYTNIWLTTSQLMWITRCFLTVMNNYYQADTEFGQRVLTGIWSFTCIGTYMSTMISATMIIRIFNLAQNHSISYILYGVITLISTVLGGPTYVYFVIYETLDVPFMYDFYEFYVDQMYFGWELFMFIFDIIPPIMYLIKMQELNFSKLKANQTAQFFKWRKFALFFLAMELSNIISYMVVFYYQYYSLELGGDLQYESVWMILMLNYCIHNSVIILMFECLKEMMKVTVKSSIKKEEKKKTATDIATIKDTRAT
ncbi:hypothetical protein HDV01_000599 [Terramyces sp. JEL0728]|nr:hypothetical protein HDV01_000599 [Terramyces sp. JEL0728]